MSTTEDNLFYREAPAEPISVQLVMTRAQADRLLSHLCEVEQHFDLQPDATAELDAVRRLLAQGIVEYDRTNRARWAEDAVEDTDLCCCEWCGDEYPSAKMATAEFCEECIHVVDLGSEQDV